MRIPLQVAPRNSGSQIDRAGAPRDSGEEPVELEVEQETRLPRFISEIDRDQGLAMERPLRSGGGGSPAVAGVVAEHSVRRPDFVRVEPRQRGADVGERGGRM